MPVETARREWRKLTTASGHLNRQVVFILVSAAVLLVIQFSAGSRGTFRTHLAPFFLEEWRGVLSWGWWFTMQGVTGFVLPVLILTVLFKRRPAEIGLGAGDWRFALTVAGLYLPLVIIGTWFLSGQASFRSVYPHYGPAALDWRFFVAYELFYLFYWIGWEYLWRGFLLFGTAPVFGVHAVFVQMLPFAALHLNKPVPEALLSIAGAIALGALVWRCRSFWIAIPIHALQMLSLDLWCTLRTRTGITDTGLDAFFQILRASG